MTSTFPVGIGYTYKGVILCQACKEGHLIPYSNTMVSVLFYCDVCGKHFIKINGGKAQRIFLAQDEIEMQNGRRNFR